MTKLKPCPFCVGTPEVEGINSGNPFMVYCENCGLEFGRDKEFYYYQAVEAWNRRPEPRQLTLDELLQMPDGYIWVEDWSEDLPFKAWGYKRDDKISILVWTDKVYGLVTKDLRENYYQKWYGKEWAAYDRLPGDSL